MTTRRTFIALLGGACGCCLAVGGAGAAGAQGRSNQGDPPSDGEDRKNDRLVANGARAAC